MQAWAERAYPRDLLSKENAEGDWQPGVIKIDWPNKATSPAAAMIHRLRAQWRGDSLVSRLFARWDLGADQHFGDVDLSSFDLIGVNLRGAKLNGADCSRLDIDSARLQSADLSQAVNLEQGQIDKAHGSSKTNLPDGMTRPGHWSDDG